MSNLDWPDRHAPRK